MGVMIIVKRQPHLLHRVLALRPAGRFAGLLDSGEQQRNQDRDNRDHHQKFDERETISFARARANQPHRHLPETEDWNQRWRRSEARRSLLNYLEVIGP